MTFSSTILKLLAGLALLAVITFGKSVASASQGSGNLAESASKPGGTSIVAIAVLVVGVAGFQRRKG